MNDGCTGWYESCEGVRCVAGRKNRSCFAIGGLSCGRFASGAYLGGPILPRPLSVSSLAA